MAMGKYKFITEFEFKASPKVLFPYISTASGLQEWFAAKVFTRGDSVSFDFLWDNESHPARLSVNRLNKMTRFDFLNDEQRGNFVEFKLELSEMVNSTFLKITDNSDNEDATDLQDMWEGMVYKLKEIVGG